MNFESPVRIIAAVFNLRLRRNISSCATQRKSDILDVPTPSPLFAAILRSDPLIADFGCIQICKNPRRDVISVVSAEQVNRTYSSPALILSISYDLPVWNLIRPGNSYSCATRVSQRISQGNSGVRARAFLGASPRGRPLKTVRVPGSRGRTESFKRAKSVRIVIYLQTNFCQTPSGVETKIPGRRHRSNLM